MARPNSNVVMYPDRAGRFRAAGGLPARLDFGAPKPEIVAAIVRGTAPIFCAPTNPRWLPRVVMSRSWRHRLAVPVSETKLGPRPAHAYARISRPVPRIRICACAPVIAAW